MSQSFFDSNFWSAIVGAVLGGVIALLAQLAAIRNERKTKEIEKRELQSAHGMAVLTKLARMHKQLKALVTHFNKCKAEHPDLEPWAWARPFAALPLPSDFTSDELVTIFRLDAALMSELVDLNDNYRVALGTYDLFMENRARLITIGSPARIGDMVAHVTWDNAAEREAMLLRASLNQLAPTMLEHNAADEGKIRALINRTTTVMNSKLGTTLTAMVGVSAPAEPLPITKL
ncbi:hypothetical protein OF829_14700 [Sphingomonas sp. LB-2]|uniref:hypothetical protein n=1 Tax=Sphingomonas caeni TaxID=2984949 RepID=UPI00223119FE|nr:hypothetical protein [Sphingomonas caeni]MCW3848488.1 hypothetical protein [Sphingomonas caeni]